MRYRLKASEIVSGTARRTAASWHVVVEVSPGLAVSEPGLRCSGRETRFRDSAAEGVQATFAAPSSVSGSFLQAGSTFCLKAVEPLVPCLSRNSECTAQLCHRQHASLRRLHKQ